MSVTLHFDSPESIITWIETLTNSAIALMSEIVAERAACENLDIVDWSQNSTKNGTLSSSALIYADASKQR